MRSLAPLVGGPLLVDESLQRRVLRLQLRQPAAGGLLFRLQRCRLGAQCRRLRLQCDGRLRRSRLLLQLPLRLR